jgi:hypothetical protein
MQTILNSTTGKLEKSSHGFKERLILRMLLKQLRTWSFLPIAIIVFFTGGCSSSGWGINKPSECEKKLARDQLSLHSQ